MDDSETVPTYFNAEEAEALLENGIDQLDRPRSAVIKEALAVYLGVIDASADLKTEDRSLMDLRQWVRYMLLEYERDRDPDEVIRRLTNDG